MSNISALVVSVVSLAVSVTTAVLSLKERYQSLRCKLLGREEFFVTATDIEAVLVVFNSGSRPNCIEYIGMYVNGQPILSDFIKKIDKDEEGVESEPVPFNRVPTNLGPGSGESLRLLGMQWASAQRPRECKLTVAVTDVYGGVVKVHKTFTNKWSQLPIA